MHLGRCPMQSVEFKPSLPGIPCSLHHPSLLIHSRGKAVSSKTSGEQTASSLMEVCVWLQQGISDGAALPRSCSGAVCPSPGLSAEPLACCSVRNSLWANNPSSPGRNAWQRPSTCPSRGATGPVYSGRPRELRIKWIGELRG